MRQLFCWLFGTVLELSLGFLGGGIVAFLMVTLLWIPALLLDENLDTWVTPAFGILTVVAVFATCLASFRQWLRTRDLRLVAGIIGMLYWALPRLLEFFAGIEILPAGFESLWKIAIGSAVTSGILLWVSRK